MGLLTGVINFTLLAHTSPHRATGTLFTPSWGGDVAGATAGVDKWGHLCAPNWVQTRLVIV